MNLENVEKVENLGLDNKKSMLRAFARSRAKKHYKTNVFDIQKMDLKYTSCGL